MKKSLDLLARDIFSALESENSEKDLELAAKLPEIAKLILPEELEEFGKLKPCDLIRTELRRIRETYDMVLPLVTLTENITEDMAKSRSGFLPLSPYFDHFMKNLEELRKGAVKFAAQSTHPVVYTFLTKACSLIVTLGNAISSTSFAEAFAEDREKLSELISNRQENEIQIGDLRAMLEKKDAEVQRFRDQLMHYVRANGVKIEEEWERLAAIHEEEIKSVVAQCLSEDV
jgi:hypothetical protein